MTKSINRRRFLKAAGAAGAGIGVAGPSAVRPGFAKTTLLGSPNQALRIAVMGVNARGNELARAFAHQTDAEVAYIADVDVRAVEKTVADVAAIQGTAPAGIGDFRRALEDPEVDALAIAAPDHWHTPAAIMAMQAGKHVYVEKPCGHNPREGELLVEAQQTYGRVVQMGTQQRSGETTIEAIQFIKEGGIGRPYMGRAWYANSRESIGTGQPAPVPEWLDYELWQGPAPRTPYRDNIIHYNWHWFRRWGTGESCNNGTHEIDICRWALGVDYPVRAQSSGGRYHYDDDWEFYDTQLLNFDFADEVTITWEGRSCQPFPVHGRSRGSAIFGTEGTVIMDRNGYEIFDVENNPIREVQAETVEATMDVSGGGGLTDLHVENFLDAIRGDAELASTIEEGHKSVLLCHLGNIAQEVGQTLYCDQETGRIIDNPEAMAFWSREYEPGWEPRV